MTLGITYAGDLGRVGQETSPEQAVELVCTDPRFVERAAAKKPNLIIRLFNGAVSFPRDWWYGATFAATRANIFDAEGRAATDGTANKLGDLIRAALGNPGFTVRTIRILLGHAVHYPELYGRQGTVLASTILLKTVTTYTGVGAFVPAVSLFNFILASLGAAARAVDNGANTMAELLAAIAIGGTDPELVAALQRDLINLSPADGDYDISEEQEKVLLYILEGILHCLRNPGEYVNRNKARATRMVPVGMVSSARPKGVMGLIPAGHETNALDMISDENYLLRQMQGGGG